MYVSNSGFQAVILSRVNNTNTYQQVYQAKDAPYYKMGNKVLIALAVSSGALFIFAKFYYDWWNKYVFTFFYVYRIKLLTQ